MNYADRMLLARRYAHAFVAAFSTSLRDTSSQPFFDVCRYARNKTVPLQLLAHVSDVTMFARCAQALLDRFQLDTCCMVLLTLLRNDRRMELFGDICYRIGICLDESENTERAMVSCWPKLTAEQEATIAQFLSKKRGGARMLFSMIVDDRLIAGVRVIGSDWMWEHSVAQKLRSLEALCQRYNT